MVPADSDRVPRAPPYSGTLLIQGKDYVYGTITLFGLPFQIIPLLFTLDTGGGPTTPQVPKHPWFGLFPVRSPLLRESLLFSFPPGTEMFQFPGLASLAG